MELESAICYLQKAILKSYVPQNRWDLMCRDHTLKKDLHCIRACLVQGGDPEQALRPFESALLDMAQGASLSPDERFYCSVMYGVLLDLSKILSLEEMKYRLLLFG